MDANLVRAIDLALAGQWDAAHGIVQQYETDATAAWVHAVLHKIEGDEANSRYWYLRAGKLGHAADDPTAELAAIKRGPAGGEGGAPTSKQRNTRNTRKGGQE